MKSLKAGSELLGQFCKPLFSAAQLGTMHLDKVEESCLLASIIPFLGMVKEEEILFLGKLSSEKESIKPQ